MNQKFEKLKEYFLNLSPTDVLVKSNNHSFIHLDWIFTDLVSRETIQKAIINIVKRERPNNNRVQKVEGIEGFEVVRSKGRLIFQAQGSDNFTKINFSDDESVIEEDKDKKLITHSFDELRDEIRNVLGNKNLDEANSKLILAGMEKAFEDACSNLLKYYQYLLEEKKEHSKRNFVISQRTDNAKHKENSGDRTRSPRVNDIISFSERGAFLESLNPSTRVDIDEFDETGRLQPAYHVYMYQDNLLQNSNQTSKGYLFVGEPIQGNRGTRVFYLSPEEFEAYHVEKGKDKISKIVRDYLEMSQKEFAYKEKGTTILAHTDLETYKERVSFYKDASKAKSLTNLKRYKNTLSKLYGKDIVLPYYKPKTAEDIGKIGAGARNADRTAQDSLITVEKDTGEVFDS